MPLDLLKTKQDRLTAELAAVEERLSEVEADFARAESNLERALAFAGNCQTAYQEASPTMRRQFNLAFFERLFITSTTRSRGSWPRPSTPSSVISPRRAIERANENLREAIDEALRRREAQQEQRPPALPVGADPPTTSVEVVGWSQGSMVEPTRLNANRFASLAGGRMSLDEAD